MNAPELLRAGGWRQVPSVGGSVDWQHLERHGTTRFELGAAMLDELERVSADRVREAHGFARREQALQIQVADLQRIEELAKRKPNYQTALEAWSAEIGQRQAAQAELDKALLLLRKAAPALLEGAKELRKAVERARPTAPEPSADYYKGLWEVECDRTSDALEKQRAAEAQLAAVRARVGELEAWLRAGVPYVSTKRTAELVAALLTHAPTPTVTEPHWLLKDFHVLYASARALADACNGRGDGRPYLPLQALEAQLERLKPAFAETEAARAELAGRGGA
jgi:hypothetical protein